MDRARLLNVAVAAGAAGVAGAAVGLVVAGRRWAAGDDPGAVPPLTAPDSTEHRIPTADGGELAAIVAGNSSGRTFVLAHGWTNDHRTWAPVARLLVERGHQVVLYDQRGHGSSRPGSDGLTIEALGADMATVLENLDVRDAVLAGHSMGGMAAQAFAIEHPEVLADRVRGVALVSTGCSNIGVAGRVAKLAPRVVGSRHIGRFISNAHLGPALMRSTMGRRASLANLRAMQETFTATSPATRGDFLGAMMAMDFSGSLTGVDVPVIVVSGTRDQLVAHATSRRLAELISGARFVALPGSGHMLPLEEPAVLADVLEELAESSPVPELTATRS
jgi:pimeloyl-ACP methyl ester carboxylesterase